jgi:hypothetical protein
MGVMNWKHPTAIKGTMHHAKSITQHRDICWCNHERGSIFSAAIVIGS